MTGDQRPIFSVTNGDKTYEIYADGYVTGFDSEKPLIVNNRIPQFAAERIQEHLASLK